MITDNGKQFTDRFGKGGEVMFDRICRKNGIKHRLTQPASPNQNGKVERFHGTLRPDFFDNAGPFTSVAEAQTALDVWVNEYNTDRPHQALDAKVPVVPADRFETVPAEQRELLPLWLPPALVTTPDTTGADLIMTHLIVASIMIMVSRSPVGLGGRVGRSPSMRWCRRRGTCRSRSGSSGSARPGRV